MPEWLQAWSRPQDDDPENLRTPQTIGPGTDAPELTKPAKVIHTQQGERVNRQQALSGTGKNRTAWWKHTEHFGISSQSIQEVA